MKTVHVALLFENESELAALFGSKLTTMWNGVVRGSYQIVSMGATEDGIAAIQANEKLTLMPDHVYYDEITDDQWSSLPEPIVKAAVDANVESGLDLAKIVKATWGRYARDLYRDVT